MAYTYKTKTAARKNYGAKRSEKEIKFLVLHFTANDGDTDENNGKYFANNVVYASAHDFVDDDSITHSVPYNYIAYSVGGSKWATCKLTGGGKFYGKCTNENSISIELCDDKKNGSIYPSAKTIENAIDHVKKLMKKYNIPAERVIRHFDVTGKLCPAYWCGTYSKDSKWKSAFWNKLKEEKKETVKETAKPKKEAFKAYKVKVTTKSLNVRKGAGTSYNVVTQVKKNEVYTIVDEKKIGANKWGKLLSGAGWIHLGYTKKV